MLKSNLIGYVPDYVAKSDIAKNKLVVITDPIKTFHYSIKVIWPLRRQMPKSAELLINEVRKAHFI
jgi:DNA-binding transcriptional LysR family regulator